MEGNHKKSKKKIIILFSVIGVLLVAGLVTFLLLLNNRFFTIKRFENDLIVNYKTEFDYNNPSVCFGNVFGCDELKPSVEGEVKTDELGKYTVFYTYSSEDRTLKLEQNVEVKDIETPVISVDVDEFTVCKNGRPLNAKITASDNLDGDLTSKLEYGLIGDELTVSVKDSAGNTASKQYKATIVDDTEAPKITLNGDAQVTLIVGAKYEEQGATVEDNCDPEIELVTEGVVDTSKSGTYTVTYRAKDSSGNEATAVRKVVVNRKAVPAADNGTKVIYLTFDDGPSAFTGQLLDILKKYDVKVTFFLTGGSPNLSSAPYTFSQIVKREYDEGHSIGLHTHSHTYSAVYRDDETFMDDLRWIQGEVRDATGGYESNLMRFPGGSSNTVSKSYNKGIMTRLTKRVAEEGFYYFDWNVSSGDAGGATTADAVYNNVVSTLKAGSSVVLQHDTKKFSIDAVERIINYGLDNGYTFKPLTPASPGAHHGVNN